MIDKEITAMTEAVNALNAANPQSAVLVMGVIMLLVVLIFWRLSTKSIKAADDARLLITDVYLEERGKTRNTLTTLTDGVVKLATQLEIVQTSVDSFTLRFVETMKQMDGMLQQWGTITTAVPIAMKELTSTHEQEMVALRNEVTKKMEKVEKGNHDIYNQLEMMGERLNRLIATLEAANFEEFATIPENINALMVEIKSAVERVAVQREETQKQADAADMGNEDGTLDE